MTIGASGSYGINGTDFTLQPTEGRWIPQQEVGTTGDGHPIYPATHQYQIRWVLTSPSELYQFQQFRDSVVLTGTASIDLPDYRNPEYAFKTYSGCALYEPERGAFFNEYITDIVLNIGNIRV